MSDNIIDMTSMRAESEIYSAVMDLESDIILVTSTWPMLRLNDENHSEQRQAMYDMLKHIENIAEKTSSCFKSLCEYHGQPLQ